MRDPSELGIIKIISIDERIAFKMLEYAEKCKFGEHILLTAVNVKADILATRDESFKRIKEIKVKIPDELT
ncbi:MAG: hypothetical protein QXO32_07460 [Candidatus Bathyarchaeia archaeon]